MTTINMLLSWAEIKVNTDGSIVLTIAGQSPGEKSLKLHVKMGPETIGYVAEEFHKAVKLMQARLDYVRRQLKGEG
jgi:hypothetical protein